jgi:hypothetical protein
MPVGNDSLLMQIDIRDGSNVLVSENVTTDNFGFSPLQSRTVDVIPVGQHDIAIKGLSHLRKVFRNVNFGPANTFTIDLYPPSGTSFWDEHQNYVLRAGDTHPTSDNYVNSLDLSYSIVKIYSGDLRADLNRDTKVNSLDFPTMITHLYEYGEN